MHFIKLLFMFVVLLFHTIYALDYLPHSEVEGDPSGIVAGCVNVIRGTFSHHSTDILIPGAEPLTMRRSYVSGNWLGSLCENWTYDHVHEAIISDHSSYYKFIIPEMTGGAASYISLNKYTGVENCLTRKVSIDVPQKSCDAFQRIVTLDAGLTNLGTDEIGGHTNLKNQNVRYDAETKTLHVNLCHGGSRTFKRYRKLDAVFLPIPMGCESEVLPNGNCFFYGYSKGGQRNLIVSTNSDKSVTFGSLTYDESKLTGNPRTLRMVANDGRSIDYTFEMLNNDALGFLKHVERPNAPPESYTYSKIASVYSNYIRRIDGVNGRYKQVEYWRAGPCNIFGKKFKITDLDPVIGRVMQLENPSGPGGRNAITHRFFYGKLEDGTSYTNVYDGNNHATVYFYNSQNRLVKISKNLGDWPGRYTYYSQYRYFWGYGKKNQHCNLICKALCDGKENVRSCRYLEYDGKHNVIAEHILGSLTGENETPPKLDASGIPIDNGCERYTKYATYYDDARNLKQSETLSTGLSTTWEYQPNTNLPTVKLTMAHGQIVEREYYAYDANAVLIEAITDDGNSAFSDSLDGATWRKVTRIIPKVTAPCLGLPEVVSRFYVDPKTHVEHPLGFVVNDYSIEGWVTSQAHHDANGELRYTLRWEYDSFGNPILEQDALGHMTHRRFDANSNKIYEQGPNPLLHTIYTYDLMNRLVGEEMICSDGQHFSISHEYDVMGNRLSSTDALGKVTRCSYDELNRVVATTMQGDVGEHVIRLDYDIAGNVISQTDIDGTITRTQYNVRNQPTRIDHPDATFELFRYTLEGRLKQHRYRNGSMTHYEYDPLGHVIRKVIYSEDGTRLCGESATYKGNLLISQTDASGNSTSYHYDGAGRLTETLTPTGWSRYVYDSLGRKQQTIDWYGPDEHQVRVTYEEHDLLNRVTETRIEDGEGNTLNRQLTDYNEAGQISAVTTFTEEGPAVTQTFYDAFGKVNRVIDALSQETLTHYNYRYINANNQQVLQITQVDAMGLTQVITHTALGHPCEIVHKDRFGNVLRHAVQEHTPKGQLIERKDYIKAEGKDDREFIVEWIYDAVGRPVVLTEGKGSPQARQTYYSYNSYGQKESETFHDGVSLRFLYDGMGRQTQLIASDGTVCYQFSYDGNGNVIAVDDTIHHTITTRQFDAGNRLTAETLANGLIMNYKYDGLNRMTQIELPDASKIHYEFGANHLNAVHRLNSRGEVRLTHKYLKRDPSGLITQTQLVGFAGEVSYSRDVLGRLQHLCHAQFEEEIPPEGYDAVGNLLCVKQRDCVSQTLRSYTYDTLYQLVREEGITTHDYRYDSVFNRLQCDETSCDVDALNQLVRQGDRRFTYDACGRRIGMYNADLQEATYRYDALGRLIEVCVQDKTWKYLYDAFNRRITRTAHDATGNPGEIHHYLYQGQCEIGRADEKHAITQLRVLGEGLGAELGAAVVIELDERAYAPLHDHNGNLVALLSVYNGSVAEAYRYTAFGEEQTILGEAYAFGDHFESPLSPWRLSSKRVDPETQWVYFGRRHYDPFTGRWTAPDPHSYTDGPNLYAYVMNSPISHFDLYGLRAESGERGMTAGHSSLRGADERKGQARERTQVRFGEMMRRGRKYVGDCLAKIGHHLAPCSFCQRTWVACSRAIGGEGFTLPKDYQAPSQVFVHRGKADPSEQKAIPVLSNGQDNSRSDAVDSAQKFSEANGDCSLYVAYQSTHGFVRDTIASACMFMGVWTRHVAVLGCALQMACAEAKTIDGGYVVPVCHSRGGLSFSLASKTLSAEQKSMCDVITVGSAKLIGDEGFGSAINIVDRRDGVTHLTQGVHCCAAMFGKSSYSVRFVGDYKGMPFIQHSFSNPAYMDATSDRFKYISERRSM